MTEQARAKAKAKRRAARVEKQAAHKQQQRQRVGRIQIVPPHVVEPEKPHPPWWRKWWPK